MALGTYNDLKETVIRWSHRNDILDMIPNFVLLAEYEIYNNAQTQLRVRETETVSTASVDSRYLELPPNFEKARSAKIITGNGYCDIEFQAPEQMIRHNTTGQPRFFSVIGNEIEFDREPDSAYDIQVQYYKKPDAISEDNQTNSVLTGYPNIYLYSVLHQVFLWSEDIDEAMKYASKAQDSIKGANKADKKARYGAAPSMSVSGSIA